MIRTGWTPFSGSDKSRRYFSDEDWEVSDELSPDPFAEEEHTRIHGSRFLNRHRNNEAGNIKNYKNAQIQEDTGDNT